MREHTTYPLLLKGHFLSGFDLLCLPVLSSSSPSRINYLYPKSAEAKTNCLLTLFTKVLTRYQSTIPSTVTGGHHAKNIRREGFFYVIALQLLVFLIEVFSVVANDR